MSISKKTFVLTAFLWSRFFLPVYAAPIPPDAGALSDTTLIDLDLESLMDVEVYSASKKTQRLSDISSERSPGLSGTLPSASRKWPLKVDIS